MGTTPTHTVSADLNGTGTLVPITSYVDFTAGIVARTGRSDWTAETPRPGTATFTLDNLDGRFTPGNTATYATGLVEGTLVEWTTQIGASAATVIDEFENGGPGGWGATVDANTGVLGDGTDTSKTWASNTAGGAATWYINNQEIRCDGTGESVLSVNAGTTDVTLLTTLRVSTGLRYSGPVFRYVDASNMWRVVVATGGWKVQKVVAGVTTDVYVSAVPCANNDVVSIVVAGALATVSINGTPLTTPIVMAEHLTATKFGFWQNATLDTTRHWGRFELQTGTSPYTRTRRYRAGVPALEFPNGGSGGAQVTVTCYDALGLLGKFKMRHMVDAEAFVVRPGGYWPLDDSGSGAVIQCDEISGSAGPALVPSGSADLFGWNRGVGPRTDARSALTLNPDATTPPTSQSAWLSTSGTVPVDSTSVDTVSFATAAAGAFSMWFNVRDVYGAAVGGGAATDGPYVFLGQFGVVTILWRIADRKIVTAFDYQTAVTDPAPQSWTMPALQPGVTHHVMVAARVDGTNMGSSIRLWVDGVDYGAKVVYQFITGASPASVLIGGGRDGANMILTGANQTVYGLSGTVSCVAAYGGADVNSASKVITGFKTLQPTEFYPAGMTGSPETSTARLARFARYLARADIAFVAQGTGQLATLAGQATSGQTYLAAICDALRFEESNLDTETLAGVDTVRAWMQSTNRDPASAVAVNVEQDGEGVPDLSYDAAGVAATVVAKGYSTSVTFEDTAAPLRYDGTSANIQAASDDLDDLRALAQFRSLLGRSAQLTPTKVTVDAVRSKNDITQSLLGLRPLQRVNLTGLPSTITGYASTSDVFVVGVTERYTNGRALFELTLAQGADFDGGFVGSFDAAPSSTLLFTNVTGGIILAASTTIYCRDRPATSTGLWPSLVPLRLIIGAEEVLVTAIGAAAPVSGSESQQALTVTRARNGTTATNHNVNEAYSFPTLVYGDASF